MRVKKSDIFKIIQEELEAVRRAIPAWLGEEIEDEDVFFDQDYDAGFKGGGEGSSTSQTLAYQLGAFDRENGLEHNPSEHPPRGPTAKVNEQDGLDSRAIEFMLQKAWKPVAEDPKNRGSMDPHQPDPEQLHPSDAIELVLDTVDPQLDWVMQFKRMDPSKQENMIQNVMGQKHGDVDIVSTQGTAGKVFDPAEGLREDEDNEKKEKPIPAYNPDTRRQQLQKRNPGRKYSLEEDAAYDALVELGKFQAKLAVEAPELAKELDQVIVQMQKAGLTQGHDQKGLDEAELKLEPGMQVKDLRTDRVGTVQSVKAGSGGGGAVIKLEDGTIEEWRAKYLEPVGGVEEIMIGDREVPSEGPADYPSLDEFAQLSSGEQQEIFDRALADYKENWRDMDPREEEMFKERFALYKQAMEADYYTEAVSADLGWTPDDLMGFLEKKINAMTGQVYPGGVTAKEMAYAFGGQWQAHAAEMQKMVDQGQLVKQGNKYVRPAVSETLRDIFGFNELEEEFTPEEEEALIKATKKKEDEVYERLRSKTMRALGEQGELYQSDRDIPQEDVERVISFLKDQRAAGIGELDLGSIMQDMGMELNTVKLIMVDRLGYNIEPSESDPRGKIFFDRPVGASRPEPGENTMSEKHEPGHEEDAVQQGEDVAIVSGGLAGAYGEVMELTTTTGGDPAVVVYLSKDADSRVMGAKGDEVIAKISDVEVDRGINDPNIDEYGMHYQEAACNKLREHVSRFMKVTLREEARHK